MAQTIYILGALTCLLCTVLLLKRWMATKLGLLFWSGICFLTLTMANILLFVDRILVPQVDLAVLRHIVTLLAIAFMLFGLIVARRNG
jgi:hypothetical protein